MSESVSFAKLWRIRRPYRWNRLSVLKGKFPMMMSEYIKSLPRIDSQPAYRKNWSLMDRKPLKYDLDMETDRTSIKFNMRKRR